MFSARLLTSLALLWLAGAGLRLTVLAVPPVMPLIRADLQLSETGVGLLFGLPPVLFALAAVPGSLLIARFGPVRTLVIGLAITALASALRGFVPSAALLYAATVFVGVGIAFMQPALPPTVRDWLPERIGFGTAVYTNGLLIGEVLPAALTIPLVLPLVGGSWRWDFVLWALPLAAIALLVATLAPRPGADPGATPMPRHWWPDWRDPQLWRLGVMLGTGNAIYFASNAFLPEYLSHTGRAGLIGWALTALNLGQLPASFVLLAAAGRLERRSWPYAFNGLLALIGAVGIVLPADWLVILAAALIGFATAATLILGLALPPLLSPPDDVHRMAAAMLTIGYSCAVVAPVLCGLAWDLSTIPSAAFAPIGGCALLLVALAATIDLSRPNGYRGRASRQRNQALTR